MRDCAPPSRPARTGAHDVPTRELLACAAAMLDQGRVVDRLSRPITAAAFIAILIGPAMTAVAWTAIAAALAVAIAGLAEAYFATRVGFDAALFHHLASVPEPDFAPLDAALGHLRLLSPSKAGRSAAARVAGACRLLRFQLLALAVQLLAVLIRAGIIAWGK